MPALLPVIPIMNKVRKGEAVAIEVEHSQTAMHGPTTYYTRFVLATVAHANRQGLATRVTIAGQSHSVETARLGKFFALKTYQCEAQILVSITTNGHAEYETKEALKEAILAAPLKTAHKAEPT